MNTLHLNSVRLNGIGEVQSVSLSAGADPEQPPVGNYIQFEDPAVEAICVANWSSDGIGLTMEDAAAVTSIGAIFKGNTEITSFDEFEYFTGVTFLGTSTNQTSGGAFNGCASLVSIKIPSSVTHLRPGAFYNCTSLRHAGDLSHVKQIDIYVFRKTALEGEISLASAEGTIGYSAFQGTNITKVASLGNATTLGGSTPIGTSAFGQCGLLESIDLNSVQVFQTGALSGCTSLKEIIAPSATDVQMYAFSTCSAATLIDLGSGVTHIGSYAFNKCSSLTALICRAATPPTLDNVNAFTSTNDCPIYVPDASLEAYKTATNWSTYADRIHPLSEIEGVVIEHNVKVNTQTGAMDDTEGWSTLKYVQITGGHTLAWGVPELKSSMGPLVEYTEAFDYVDYWLPSTNPRTITTNSTSRYVCISFKTDSLDYAYLYDSTDGKYLYKGQAITE